MKVIKIIFLLFLISNYSIAQSINDSIFKDVILIEKRDVVQHDKDYLIDVVMDYKKIPVILNDSRLSTSFFTDKLFTDKPIILITPDWEFYKTVAEEAEKEGLCIEPATTNIYYQRTYFDEKPKVDNIRISGNQPKLIFSQNIKTLKANNNIIFYYSDSFSLVDDKETKWSKEKDLYKYIHSFENKNKAKIGDVYYRYHDNQGIYTLYFTLSDLNKKQKLIFLQGLNSFRFGNNISKIFTANSIKRKGLKLKK